jgi:hypothetical protein
MSQYEGVRGSLCLAKWDMTESRTYRY